MTEAEIIHRLRHGWIGKTERKALERHLAAMRSSASAAPAVASATSSGARLPAAYCSSPIVSLAVAPAGGDQYEHIRIYGCAAFVRASKAALGILMGINSWRWLPYLRALREAEDTISSGGIAGYCDRASRTFVVFPAAWRNSRAKDFAALILHEAAHAAHPPTGDTAEDERIAMRIENQGRREMGFMFTFQPENNPTHHVQWERDWNAKHGASRHA